MMHTEIARGYIFYQDEWWEVLREEGKDGYLITFGGKNKHITMSDLGMVVGKVKKRVKRKS